MTSLLTSTLCFQKELLDEKNVVKVQRRQLEKMKMECDKLTEELTQNEEENIKLRRKYELVKKELEEKVNICPHLFGHLMQNGQNPSNFTDVFKTASEFT